jgi:transposase
MNTSTQPTVGEVPEEVWTLSEQVLHDVDPAKPTGQRRGNRRRVLNGLICRRRTGGPWTQRPQQCGDDSTGQRHFQRGGARGVCARLWAVRVHACDAWGSVAWPWHAAAARGNARLGGDRVGRHPTARGEKG